MSGQEADRFRCPACGHWCRWVDDAWVCSKRGGCGAEYTPDGPAEDAQDVSGQGGCGHPNNDAGDHDCRPFRVGSQVSLEQVDAARLKTNGAAHGYAPIGWPEAFLAALGVETRSTTERDDDAVERIRETHAQGWRSTADEARGRPSVCLEDWQEWPCSTAVVLAALDAARGDGAPSVTAGQVERRARARADAEAARTGQEPYSDVSWGIVRHGRIGALLDDLTALGIEMRS